jgi:hypothetical protein
MPRTFNLQEAEDCLPRIEEWLRDAIDSKRRALAAEEELQAVKQRIQSYGGVEIRPAEVARHRAVKNSSMERLRKALGNIDQIGCLIKDLDIGLIDFPAMLGADEVYLCWKLGEPRIEFWHPVQDGFAGRKPIRDEFGESTGPSRPS